MTDKLCVYASFYPMYDFASKVGGERAGVSVMVPDGTEPHEWEPAAADIAGLEKADVFIYNGADMEHWVSKVLASLQNKNLIVSEASGGVTLLEDGGGENAGRDPHVWLNPQNAKAEMENIKNAFAEADPENADYYERNYEKYAAEFDKLDAEFRDTLSSCKNRDIVVTHQAFGYLCAAYGLNQVPVEGSSPDSEPDPAKLSEIIGFAKEHGVKTVFYEELSSDKVAKAVADAVGAKAEVLSPARGDSAMRSGLRTATIFRSCGKTSGRSQTL